MRRAFRGQILHFLDDPAAAGTAYEYIEDGVLVVADGKVESVGEARALPSDVPVVDHSGRLILPGFVDTHIHYPQTDVIASYGEALLPWLERYTFPAERRFADPAHARATAAFFIDELLRNGTTSAVVYATVHAESVDAIFEAALAKRMRIASGKVMMDRNAPGYLRDTPESSHRDSEALIRKWHGRERLLYAVTPRFAGSSSPAQLERAAALFADHPGTLLQSHLAENRAEVAWIASMFPEARSYLDVYDRFGLLGRRAIYGHCIHIDDADRARLAQTGTAIAFCPTSNLFLGSGLFDLAAADACGVRVGMATDVGAGTSFSMLRTLSEAYKVAALGGQTLDALRAFYLATLGGARALDLDAAIGNFLPGKEADFIVLDPAATPLVARRIARCESLAERLFVFLMLGDDRAVSATYVLGNQALT